jgi:lysine/ornithine N-monooxygenase/predicted FMN-binding regulatory protein PaiB
MPNFEANSIRNPANNGFQENLYDYIGIGFGPSNLAVAVAASELPLPPSGLFLELKPSVQWHSGMMFDDARMQVFYLKDLVTLRNPTSKFTILQYLKTKGRLERFINLRESRLTRFEYQDYLGWVASAFHHQVRYRSRAVQISPILNQSGDRIAALRVQVATEDQPNERVISYLTRNLIYAPGGLPYQLEEQVKPSAAIMHSGDFLERFPARFPDRNRSYAFAVVGSGQSAAEIARYLLREYPASRVDLIVRGYGFRQADDSPFINEVFFAEEMARFHSLDEVSRHDELDCLRNTNYGVADLDLIRSLYQLTYLDEVHGRQRLRFRNFSTLVSAAERDGDIEAVVTDSTRMQVTSRYHALVLATGYRRQLDSLLFEPLLPFLRRDKKAGLLISRDYRVETTVPMDGGIYVQGLAESSHGIGDTLLSLLPFRSAEIIGSICGRTPQNAHREKPLAKSIVVNTVRQAKGEYPPKRHIEDDLDKLYSVLMRFPFATVISAKENDSVVTHVPMTLDRSRGKKGVLFGHMDRHNPHVELLDGRPVLAVFHGPNAYISPHVYETSQLPTWNSITVHIRGQARWIPDQNQTIRGLLGICEHVDRDVEGYRLSLDDKRIAKLIDYIVGFEIEIETMEGKFKLSQDRSPRDQELAEGALISRTEEGERTFIENICRTAQPLKISN